MSGPAKYIGKILLDDYSSRSTLVEQLSKSKWIKMMPALDYMTPVQGGPQGIMKMPVLTPLDITTAPTPVHVEATGIIFFEDMQEQDRKSYKDLVDKIMQEIESARVKASTGLEVVSKLPNRMV